MKNRIKERRTELGMSQEELASQCEIGRSTLAEIEAGKHEPGIKTALLIAKELGEKAEELFLFD